MSWLNRFKKATSFLRKTPSVGNNTRKANGNAASGSAASGNGASGNGASGNSKRRTLSFSPETRVRNQYETFNQQTGRLTVNKVNYDVNATGNVNMPGYPLSSPHFRPHSKSSLQAAETAMANLREQKNAESSPGYIGPRKLKGVFKSELVTGLSPALSSVPYNGYVNYTIGFRNAEKNMHNLQDKYGNTWANVTVLRETINEEKEQLLSSINKRFISEVLAMEKDFFDKTGYVAITILMEERDEKIAQLIHEGLTQTGYDKKLARINETFERQKAALPKGPADIYEAIMLDKIDRLEKEVTGVLKFYNKRFLNEAKVGNPIVRRTQKSLANRLRNANAIAKNN
jgi:hypothetical protein